jgi:hypothetical protein
MKIKHKPQFNIEKVTTHYTKKDGVPVRYVCTSDLDESDRPFDIYYRDTPHPDHNNYYFGLYADDEERMMICKADSIEKYQFGMISDQDEWVYSRSHHDLVETESGHIDGGRKYIKRGGDLDNQKHVVAEVVDGEFVTKITFGEKND